MIETNSANPPIRRIVLTGFMGSGKSTVGPLLAARLGWQFTDTDDVLVADFGMPIHEFFARHGEPAFRQHEQAVIARLLSQDAFVLALGGGAIESADTRDLLLSHPGTLLVHLEASLETSLTRCSGTESIRPVLADRANLRSRYDKRLPLYRAAHFSVHVDALTPDQVTDAIRQALDII